MSRSLLTLTMLGGAASVIGACGFEPLLAAARSLRAGAYAARQQQQEHQQQPRQEGPMDS